MTTEATITAPVLACPSCSQEMLCDDDGTLPLHTTHDRDPATGSAVCPGSYGQGQPSRSGPTIRAPYTPGQIDGRAAMEALESRTCWHCGEPKRRGNAFDKKCFKAVRPIDVRLNLYREVGDGFEQAFSLALANLAAQRADAADASGNFSFEPSATSVVGPSDNRL